MTYSPPSVLEELEALGYETRVVDGHISVINGDGAEVVALPLHALDRAREAGTPRSTWTAVLPADLLGRRD